MSKDLEVVTRLESLSSETIGDFVSTFGDDIQSIILENEGADSFYRENLLNVISELTFRLKNKISFKEFDIRTLINTLSYLFLIKDRISKKKPIIYSVKHYDMRSVKLLSYTLIAHDKECENTINNIGEPGRTILKLSFFEKGSDKEIADHVQFDSIEVLQQRRVKLVDRCSDILF